MHQAAFSFFNIEGSYELIDVPPDSVQLWLDQLVARQTLSGFNVTVPHKESVFKWLRASHNVDKEFFLSREAYMAGAVNSLRLGSDGTMYAHNTDIGGFRAALKSLTEGIDADISHIIIMGAGGVARACAAAFALEGAAKVFVMARDKEKASTMCEQLSSTGFFQHTSLFGCDFGDLKALTPDMVINCTSVGLGHEKPPDYMGDVVGKISPNGVFFDTVYNRLSDTTSLCALAKSHGIRQADGKSMLVGQAALAFQFWTGRRPPFKLMSDALHAAAGS